MRKPEGAVKMTWGQRASVRPEELSSIPETHTVENEKTDP